jgi:hypothetical protein
MIDPGQHLQQCFRLRSTIAIPLFNDRMNNRAASPPQQAPATARMPLVPILRTFRVNQVTIENGLVESLLIKIRMVLRILFSVRGHLSSLLVSYGSGLFPRVLWLGVLRNPGFHYKSAKLFALVFAKQRAVTSQRWVRLRVPELVTLHKNH